MKNAPTLRRGLLALLLTAAAIFAASHMASAQNAKPTVYILKTRQTGPSPEFGDLTDFALRLVTLRLAEMKSFATKQALTADEQDIARLCEKGQGQSTDAQTQQVALANEANFYVLRTVLEVRVRESAEAEMVLDYELSKYVRCERISVASSKELFPESEVLKYLNSMADVVALLLNKERTVTKALVDVRIASRDNTADIAGRLTEMLKEDLKQASDFDVVGANATTPDFTIKGEVSGSGSVRYSLQIVTKDGYEYPRKMIAGPDAKRRTEEKLATFYKEATFAAYDYLRHVRYVAEARRNTPLDADERARMMERAVRLMCASNPVPADCKQQPESAILILTEINERQKTTDYALLGKAQLLVGDYAAAAESFDAARPRGAEAPPEAVIGLLNQAGDAWFRAGRSDKAIERFKESLRIYAANRTKLSTSLREEEPKIQVQLARSYRYDHQNILALKVILGAWEAQPDTVEIKQELQYLLSDLPSEERPEALKLLDGYKGRPQYEVAQSMLRSVVATEEVLQAMFLFELRHLELPEHQESLFKEIDDKLENVEDLPPSQLEPGTRVLAQTLRALWYRDYKKDPKTAIGLLEKAAAEKVDNSDISQAFLAEAFYRLARESRRTDSTPLYEKAAVLLKAQVKEGKPVSYMQLVEVNHELGNDKETRILLEERGKQDNKDFHVFEALAELCTHYLFDLKCARDSVEAVRSATGKPGIWRTSAGTLAEIDLFSGRYVEALEEFKRGNNLLLSALSDFYSTWALFAMKREADAQAAARIWRANVERLRKGKIKIDFVKIGILQALERETNLTATQKELLRTMLAVMEDESATLPSFQ